MAEELSEAMWRALGVLRRAEAERLPVVIAGRTGFADGEASVHRETAEALYDRGLVYWPDLVRVALTSEGRSRAQEAL